MKLPKDAPARVWRALRACLPRKNHCSRSLFSIAPGREGAAPRLSLSGPRLLRKTVKEKTERICETTPGKLGPRTACLLVAAVSGALGIPGLCSAQVQLPTVNLGLTNFEDGFAVPGWFLQEFPDYYNADELKDSQGTTVPGLNHLTAISTTTHVVYISQQQFMGGWLAVEALQPWVDLDVLANGTSSTVRGLGDLTVGAGLQWAPKKIGSGVFVHRFVLDVGAPTGRYSDRQPVNVGNNLVVVDPYYALTYEPGKLELSARLHYLWNSVNHEPFAGSGANTVQPGQAFHMNYSASYEMITNVRIGFNGYWLQQLTDNKVNDINVPYSLERTVGLGAGIQFFSGRDTWIHLNGYKETNVRNRPQGATVTLRFSRAIPSARTQP